MEQFKEPDRRFVHEGKHVNLSALSDDELTSLFEYFEKLHDVPEIMIDELYSRWQMDEQIMQLGLQRSEE